VAGTRNTHQVLEHPTFIRDQLKELGLDWNVILKYKLGNRTWKYKPYCTISPVAEFSEHCDEPSDSTKAADPLTCWIIIRP